MCMQCECVATVRVVQEERECCYREIWERVVVGAERMVALVQQGSCMHAHVVLDMHCWVSTQFLGVKPQIGVRDVMKKACKQTDCAAREGMVKLQAFNLFKSFTVVVDRMHARHVNMLSCLHPACVELMWAEVEALRAKMRDFSAIVHKKLLQKFWRVGEEPLPALLKCTTPAVIVDNATCFHARTRKRPREAEWQAWRVWFLERMEAYRKRRVRNAELLLKTLNW